MIVSASRRTDIPACYPQWLHNRLREGFVLVRNPMNYHKISRVRLTPDVVDGIVFWSKNPEPMLPLLDAIDIPYYFQFTLTPYGADIEPGLPDKGRLLDTFCELSRRIGAQRVVWRYDPVLLSSKYTADFHARQFARLAERLSGYTHRCTISFIDRYRSTERNARQLGLLPLPAERMIEIAAALAAAAQGFGIELDACSEAVELSHLCVGRARCVDGRIFERVWGMHLEGKKDRNQRPACGCMESVDIGAYNTCSNGCLYCYANYNPSQIAGSRARHDPDSPLLVGWPEEGDQIVERPMRSLKAPQQGRLF